MINALNNLDFKNCVLVDGPNEFRLTVNEVIDYAYDLVVSNQKAASTIDITSEDVKPKYKNLEAINKTFYFFDISIKKIA